MLSFKILLVIAMTLIICSTHARRGGGRKRKIAGRFVRVVGVVCKLKEKLEELSDDTTDPFFESLDDFCDEFESIHQTLVSKLNEKLVSPITGVPTTPMPLPTTDSVLLTSPPSKRSIMRKRLLKSLFALMQ
ncbi:hypothetical protein SNE40_011453 [Patella caerulea]|uniref:Uncharacterized protein n=1 Tax=Patella caerulea TaxID=87958 RepID=A0AAN8PIC9_PATCE